MSTASSWTNIHVADHAFGILDAGELHIESSDWSNGLVSVMDVGAMVYTGIDRGYVRLQTEVVAEPPDEIDAGPWDEIVEVSLTCAQGQLRIDALEQGPPTDLPLLSPQGAGTYRLRVHARGRDRAYDSVQNEPVEDYLVTIWPAPPTAETILRATDQCGRSLRLAASASTGLSWPEISPELLATDEHRAALHQAILDGMSKRPSDGA